MGAAKRSRAAEGQELGTGSAPAWGQQENPKPALKKPGLPRPSAHLHVWGWDVSTAGCPRAGCVPFPGLVITNLSQRKGLYMIKIEAD